MLPLTSTARFAAVRCWDVGVFPVSSEETNYTGVAAVVYKIILLAYLNVPNVAQTGRYHFLITSGGKGNKDNSFP